MVVALGGTARKDDGQGGSIWNGDGWWLRDMNLDLYGGS